MSSVLQRQVLCQAVTAEMVSRTKFERHPLRLAVFTTRPGSRYLHLLHYGSPARCIDGSIDRSSSFPFLLSLRLSEVAAVYGGA